MGQTNLSEGKWPGNRFAVIDQLLRAHRGTGGVGDVVHGGNATQVELTLQLWGQLVRETGQNGPLASLHGLDGTFGALLEKSGGACH